jgi:hypothetical protein
MQLTRRAVAYHRPPFGRGRNFAVAPQRAEAATSNLAADLRLFATTFLAGFVFVSILIA